MIKVNNIRSISKDTPILLDTSGPEVRTGKVTNGLVTLEDNKDIIITTEEVIGTKEKISISLKGITKLVEPTDLILIEDGNLELMVKEVKDKEIICQIIIGGELGNNKNVNIPNRDIDLPAITEKDIEDIKFGIKHNFDFIAASFVRSKKDVEEIRSLLKQYNAEDIKIISKVEHRKAVENIDEIIKASDGIMIARGDLAVQIETHEVPIIQKLIIKKCRKARIPCIVATEMLQSMVKSPRPTRAEITDVANAVFDGTDAVMLSKETTLGKFPFRTVETMSNILENAEDTLANEKKGLEKSSCNAEAIAKYSVNAAEELNAKFILVPTMSGSTVREISSLRPNKNILALTPNHKIKKQLSLSYAVISEVMEHPQDINQLIANATSLAYKKELVTKDDTVVITAGVPIGIAHTTNLLEIRKVQEVLEKEIILTHN